MTAPSVNVSGGGPRFAMTAKPPSRRTLTNATVSSCPAYSSSQRSDPRRAVLAPGRDDRAGEPEGRALPSDLLHDGVLGVAGELRSQVSVVGPKPTDGSTLARGIDATAVATELGALRRVSDRPHLAVGCSTGSRPKAFAKTSGRCGVHKEAPIAMTTPRSRKVKAAVKL